MMNHIGDRIQNLCDQLVAEGKERGIQVAVYHRGQQVVDAWAGIANAESGLPVDGSTVFPVFSVTKGLAATLAHLLVERGKITYETPLADAWPEFTAHGKGDITLRHALNHSAGLMNIPMGLAVKDLADWPRMCKAMADETPVFTPGTFAEYHAITYSWLVGETLRHVDGRDFPQMLREEIAEPLGLDSLFCGMPEDVKTPVAVLEEPNAAVTIDEGIPDPIPAMVRPLHVFMNLRMAQEACLPATSGVASARALARHYAALLPEGVDGVELLSPERVCLATEPQGHLRRDGEAFPWGLGYQRYQDRTLSGKSPLAFGHGGYGGSAAWADPSRRLAVAITKNLLNQHDSVADVYQILTEAF